VRNDLRGMPESRLVAAKRVCVEQVVAIKTGARDQTTPPNQSMKRRRVGLAC